jgi:hypothetical protein
VLNEYTYSLTPLLIVGLLYLFIALWILSIFGNYTDMSLWHQAGRFELFHWSLYFAGAGLASLAHGVRANNGVTRGFGIVFLSINLYTRFFEYLWQPLHKACFFALLAVTFWLCALYAEKAWNMSIK